MGVPLSIVPTAPLVLIFHVSRFLPTNRNADSKADQSSLENDRRPPHTSIVTSAPTHSLPGRDSVRSPSLTDTLGVAETSERATQYYSKRPYTSKFNFTFVGILLVYYRIYAEDGVIPSKIPASAVPSDPFLGRIKTRSVPPPHTAKAVKRCIAKMENIQDRTSTSLFLTPYSQSPMADDDKVPILSRTGPGSTPQGPLGLVAKMSDSERSALESGGGGGLASAAEPDTGIRYCTSIQVSSYFFFRNISTVERSVLSTVRRRLWCAIESSL